MKHIKEDRKGQIVSGVKIEDRVISETGASRSNQTGKGRYDLIPPCAMKRLALRYEGGAVAHGDRNWEQGMSASRCYGAAIRHLNQWSDGEVDEDHLGAAMWNVAALMFAEDKRPEHLDLPAFKERQMKALAEIKAGK